MRLRATRLMSVLHPRRVPAAAPGGTFTVLSSTGASFSAPRIVLSSTDASFTVPAAALNSSGTSFNPI
jgi:hypothetical protein